MKEAAKDLQVELRGYVARAKLHQNQAFAVLERRLGNFQAEVVSDVREFANIVSELFAEAKKGYDSSTLFNASVHENFIVKLRSILNQSIPDELLRIRLLGIFQRNKNNPAVAELENLLWTHPDEMRKEYDLVEKTLSMNVQNVPLRNNILTEMTKAFAEYEKFAPKMAVIPTEALPKKDEGLADILAKEAASFIQNLGKEISNTAAEVNELVISELKKPPKAEPSESDKDIQKLKALAAEPVKIIVHVVKPEDVQKPSKAEIDDKFLAPIDADALAAEQKRTKENPLDIKAVGKKRRAAAKRRANAPSIAHKDIEEVKAETYKVTKEETTKSTVKVKAEKETVMEAAEISENPDKKKFREGLIEFCEIQIAEMAKNQSSDQLKMIVVTLQNSKITEWTKSLYEQLHTIGSAIQADGLRKEFLEKLDIQYQKYRNDSGEIRREKAEAAQKAQQEQQRKWKEQEAQEEADRKQHEEEERKFAEEKLRQPKTEEDIAREAQATKLRKLFDEEQRKAEPDMKRLAKLVQQISSLEMASTKTHSDFMANLEEDVQSKMKRSVVQFKRAREGLRSEMERQAELLDKSMRKLNEAKEVKEDFGSADDVLKRTKANEEQTALKQPEASALEAAKEKLKAWREETKTKLNPVKDEEIVSKAQPEEPVIDKEKGEAGKGEAKPRDEVLDDIDARVARMQVEEQQHQAKSKSSSRLASKAESTPVIPETNDIKTLKGTFERLKEWLQENKEHIEDELRKLDSVFEARADALKSNLKAEMDPDFYYDNYYKNALDEPERQKAVKDVASRADISTLMGRVWRVLETIAPAIFLKPRMNAVEQYFIAKGDGERIKAAIRDGRSDEASEIADRCDAEVKLKITLCQEEVSNLKKKAAAVFAEQMILGDKIQGLERANGKGTKSPGPARASKPGSEPGSPSFNRG